MRKQDSDVADASADLTENLFIMVKEYREMSELMTRLPAFWQGEAAEAFFSGWKEEEEQRNAAFAMLDTARKALTGKDRYGQDEDDEQEKSREALPSDLL